MVVPDSVHYVYGLKPPKEGQETDIFPYYAYLAMRSAIIRLEPKVVYLYVAPVLADVATTNTCRAGRGGT